MKPICIFKYIKFKFQFEKRTRKKSELEEKVVKRTVDLRGQQKRRKESEESVLKKRKMRPGTRIHKGFLEEEEQRNIGRQLTDTAG